MSTTKQWIVEAHHAIAGPVAVIKIISKGRALEQGSLSSQALSLTIKHLCVCFRDWKILQSI
jgi:hypothetical protein